ncbi:UNKNOWN [Stylonychia lemnae]|uniref:Uncharacterized protein n=1 Tax=Stylonychia lemnae TaxID=5949 RepID=A0A078ASU5_STYLE|nr:UNKNOWN [Stylonychia lemnae]|eukprot:CDW83898.1 UNKNOWN [Stylonychia lemnae]
MFSKSNDFYTTGTTAEDQMKINVCRRENETRHNMVLYKDAAKRVVFQNCMTQCEIEPATIPNFNKNFYYNQASEQQCLQNCYNNRMNLHFGKLAESENMLIDFEAMKAQYHRYENWNPHNRDIKRFSKTNTTEEAHSITQRLIEKSNAARYGKFDF